MTKRVLITGGAHRLGSQLCETFAQAGWEVWCHYHRSAEAAEALCARVRAAGGLINSVQANLHDEAQRRRMMADIVARLALSLMRRNRLMSRGLGVNWTSTCLLRFLCPA